MQVQYIYDEAGRKTGVIIPIALWQEISRKKRGMKKKQPFDPSEYRGIYRGLAVDFEKVLGKLRQEWERV